MDAMDEDGGENENKRLSNTEAAVYKRFNKCKRPPNILH